MITDVQRKDFRGPWGKEGSLPASSPGGRGWGKEEGNYHLPNPRTPGRANSHAGRRETPDTQVTNFPKH